MPWIYSHIASVGFWMEILVGCYTVYLGVQVQRRRSLESKVKLNGGEITFGILLLIVACFLLGVHAVQLFRV